MTAIGLGLAVVAHLALFLLPGVAVAATARGWIATHGLGATSVVLLTSGLVAEISFFAFFERPGLGRAWTFAVLAASVVALAHRAGRRGLVALGRQSDVRVPAVLAAGVGVLFTASLVLYG